jgi:signal peptide peptidase SppA
MSKRNYLGFLASRILDTPLMITKAKLDQILDVVGGRIGLDIEVTEPSASIHSPPQRGYSTDSSVAIIPVHGTLVHRTHGLSALSGMTSYQSIRDSLTNALNDPEISSIMLDIDSPGGEVAGVFDLVDYIYRARSVKPITAMINERGYSAAYAIASAANNIYLSRTAGVGSIGVVMLHVDRSAADKQAGLTYTHIYAGSHKIDGTPHAPLSAEAKATAQSTVDSVYSLFVSTVARNNGLSESDVRDTQAATYHGQSAIDNGLADAILSYQEVLTNLKSQGDILTMAKRQTQTPEQEPLTQALETPDTPETVDTPAIAATDTPDTPDTPDTLTTPDTTTVDTSSIIASERDRCIAILEACNISNTPDIAMDLICDGSTIETAHKMIMGILAERTQSTRVTSAVNPVHSGATNPLLADARRRADVER